MFHLVPVFAKGAGPYGIFRNPVPSGGEDLYQREINWRHGNIPPGAHRFDKAFLLRENIFKADERAYITKLEWWGYYESKDLQDPLKMQKFRIIFYENNGRHPDTVLAKRDVRIKPTVLKYPNSRFRLGKVRSTNPRYDGRQIYGYSMEFGPSLYLKHGDLWLSIVQINEETGESVPEWVILNKGSFSLRQSFLTDYGGWQNASLETHSYVNVYGVILGREQFDHIETMN